MEKKLIIIIATCVSVVVVTGIIFIILWQLDILPKSDVTPTKKCTLGEFKQDHIYVADKTAKNVAISGDGTRVATIESDDGVNKLHYMKLNPTTDKYDLISFEELGGFELLESNSVIIGISSKGKTTAIIDNDGIVHCYDYVSDNPLATHSSIIPEDNITPITLKFDTLSEDRIFLGGINTDTAAGKFFSYIRSGSTWVLENTILPTTPRDEDYFGSFFDVNGNWLAIINKSARDTTVYTRESVDSPFTKVDSVSAVSSGLFFPVRCGIANDGSWLLQTDIEANVGDLENVGKVIPSYWNEETEKYDVSSVVIPAPVKEAGGFFGAGISTHESRFVNISYIGAVDSDVEHASTWIYEFKSDTKEFVIHKEIEGDSGTGPKNSHGLFSGFGKDDDGHVRLAVGHFTNDGVGKGKTRVMKATCS